MTPEFKITQTPEGGWHGEVGWQTYDVIPDGPCSLVMRRAIKKVGTPDAYEVAVLRAELNGVKVYITGMSVIITTQDLYP